MADSPLYPADRHFERRDRAARAGLHLTTESDLLLGMAFLADDVRRDMRAYAERLANALRRKPRDETDALVAALDQAVVRQDSDAVLAIEHALEAYERCLPAFDRADARLSAARERCRLWLAHLGDPDAANRLAGGAAHRAMSDKDSCAAERLTLMARSLAWATVSRRTEEINLRYNTKSRIPVGEEVDGLAFDFEQLVARLVRELDETAKANARMRDKADAGHAVTSGDKADRTHADHPGRWKAVVVSSLGNDNTRPGKDVAKEFQGILGVALPLKAVPDLRFVRSSLHDRFPWAVRVVDEVLADLAHHDVIRIRPTVLLGSPGSGKTRFAKDLLGLLGLPWELVPCGNMSDNAFGGTPRRWHSGEPCLPMASIRRHLCAGPGILLDEVEKAATSRLNGTLADVLIGMLGDETAARFHDPYLESECDLSHISWIMTANDAASLSGPLRDRCRIIRFPEPGPEHLLLLARRLLERHYASIGHDPRWATPLEAFELEALASAWPGGSIRGLERLVEQVARAREAKAERN